MSQSTRDTMLLTGVPTILFLAFVVGLLVALS